MSGTILPPQGAIDKLLAPATELIRRIEIFEHDGVTRFAGGAHDWRLIDGTVSVDYDRDERRTVELTLDNSDFGLSNAPGSIWYDKVIKVFHGVQISDVPVSITEYVPKVLIIENNYGGVSGANQLSTFQSILTAHGYTDQTVNLSASTLGSLAGYDIIVSLCNQYESAKEPLLAAAYEAGYSVFTTGNDTSGENFPQLIKSVSHVASPGSPTNAWTMAPNSALAGNPLVAGWSAYTGFATDVDGYYITAIPVNAIPISKTTQTTADGSKTVYNIVGTASARGGFWIHMQDFYLTPTQAQNFVGVAMNFLQPLVIQTEQYTGQIGEFDVDEISEAHFPYVIKIKGRDYTKRCLLSKFTQSENILVGISPEEVIGNIAANAGITKFLFDYSGTETGKDFMYERGTERWAAMKEIANAYNYEIFFNVQGYLVLRKFIDPNTATPIYTLKTAVSDAGLVTYEKSTNDSRLANHVAVTGEAADIVPVFGEAKNTVSGSPTSIAEIGDRVYTYSSPLIETVTQAQELADSLLRVSALEEYNLSFSNIALAYLEVGEVVQFTDPRPASGDPTTFLLTQLEISLSVGPMSGTAKRVTVVL